MRNSGLFLAGILAWAGLSLCTLSARAETAPTSVWVFTTDRLPEIRGLDLATQVLTLDAIKKPLKSLSFVYPGTEEAARQQALAVINSPKGQDVLAQMRTNAQAVALAWQHGIDKLPAVLVDETYVVYGVYDVRSALDRVERVRHAQ